MSGPQIILVPVQGQNNGQPLQVGVASPDQTSKIAQNLQQHNHPMGQNGEINSQSVSKEHMTDDSLLVNQVTSDPSILYSFINWENFGKTFASFITVMSLIISTRYFFPLQWILKALCTILGATSLVEVIGRVATNNGIMARVRPKSYYRPSKRTYSRLFSEIQEAADMTLVKLQRVMFAEDLQGSTIGFALTFAAYWLTQTIPPFWLAIATTMLTYTLGPILTGPHSANIKPVIDQKARDLTDRAVNTASSATSYTLNKTQELSSQAMDTVSSASDIAAAKARDIKDRAVNTASSATDYTANKTQDLSSQAVDTASSASSSATAKARDIKDRAVNTASSATDYTANKTQDLSSQAVDTASSASSSAAAKARDIKDRAVNTASSATDYTANKTQELSSQAVDTASSVSDSATAKAQDTKDRTVDSAAYTTDRATGKARELKNLTTETAFSATGNTDTVGNGTSNQYAINHENTPRNAPVFDDNNMAKDRSTHVHPLASEIKNTSI